jgi:hypothetical protein
MSERYDTVGELGVALSGYRSEVAGKKDLLKWMIGGVATLGVGATIFLASKVDTLEDAASRNSAILERLEASLNQVASNTEGLSDAIASVGDFPEAPNQDAFSAWRGIPLSSFSNLEEFIVTASEGDGQLIDDAWIFIPQPQ